MFSLHCHAEFVDGGACDCVGDDETVSEIVSDSVEAIRPQNIRETTFEGSKVVAWAAVEESAEAVEQGSERMMMTHSPGPGMDSSEVGVSAGVWVFSAVTAGWSSLFWL